MNKLFFVFLMISTIHLNASAAPSSQQIESVSSNVEFNNSVVSNLAKFVVKNMDLYQSILHSDLSCESNYIQKALLRISPLESAAYRSDINWIVSLFTTGNNLEQKIFYGAVLGCHFYDSYRALTLTEVPAIFLN